MREEYTFAHSSSEEVMKKLGHTEGVVLFRPKHLHNKFEDSAVVYDGSASDKGALGSWIGKNIHGLCGHRSTDNAKDFKMPLVVAYYNVDYEKNPKGTNYWRNRVLKVGKEFSGYNFAISNKDDFMNELSEFGFDHTSGDKPVVAARDAKGLKYKMTAEFDMDSFKDFLTQLEAGNVEPWIKSEPVPDNSGAGVKVAVAKNFDELVTKSEKDVLVTSSSKFLATATLTPAPELSGTGSDLIHGSTLPASSWVRKSLKDSISNSAVILYLRPL